MEEKVWVYMDEMPQWCYDEGFAPPASALKEYPEFYKQVPRELAEALEDALQKLAEVEDQINEVS
jgi:hypothetical protein